VDLVGRRVCHYPTWTAHVECKHRGASLESFKGIAMVCCNEHIPRRVSGPLEGKGRVWPVGLECVWKSARKCLSSFDLAQAQNLEGYQSPKPNASYEIPGIWSCLHFALLWRCWVSAEHFVSFDGAPLRQRRVTWVFHVLCNGVRSSYA
jgi:hypothetical protein